MVAMNLNSPTYPLSATTSSSSIALSPQDANQSSVVIYNSGSVAVFLLSGVNSAPTAVFPTSTPLAGKVLPPGGVETFTKNIGDNFISGITATGTASVYIAAGAGE